MTTIPDPQRVREIARDCVADYLGDAPDIAAHAIGHFGPGAPDDLYPWIAAVRADLHAATVSWPDEQLREFECEVCTQPITAYPCVLCEHEPDPWNRCGRLCAEMHTYEPGQCGLAPQRAEQPQDDGDVRAVRRLLMLVEADTEFSFRPAAMALRHRFADRIAALEARDTKVGGSNG